MFLYAISKEAIKNMFKGMGERALKKWMIGVTLIAAGFILTACGNGQAKKDASWEKLRTKRDRCGDFGNTISVILLR